MGKKKDWTCIRSCEFKGDIVITDPIYINQRDVLGEETLFDGRGIVSTTFYGDWGCTIYETPNEIDTIPMDAPEIGKFCSDSGNVCVVSLVDALKSAPDFESWLKEHPWCGTIIRNFSGTIKFMTATYGTRYAGKTYKQTELHVRGEGTIDGRSVTIESIQTSC